MFAHSLFERVHKNRKRIRASANQESDHRHIRPLCVRGERPRYCRAAKSTEKVAPLQEGGRPIVHLRGYHAMFIESGK
jgi:hypothetical protein